MALKFFPRRMADRLAYEAHAAAFREVSRISGGKINDAPGLNPVHYPW